MSEARSLHIFQEKIWSPIDDVNVVRKHNPLVTGQLYPRHRFSDKSLHNGRRIEKPILEGLDGASVEETCFLEELGFGVGRVD
jgi:hypothetical protein